jgi:prepilin-type processing-associated H-X9-DG protein
MRDGNMKARTAFTLVELLVIIAVIGGLIALLLPAVQSAREAARQMTCKNHLKQLALGWHLHTSAHGIFPSGGWEGSDGFSSIFSFTGDPDRGFGKSQPGTWTFSILPYIEQQALHDAGRGRGSRNAIDAAGYLTRFTTSVASFVCPTRRRDGVMRIQYEIDDVHRPANIDPRDWSNFVLDRVSVHDFAANRGGISSDPGEGGKIPRNYEEADSLGFIWQLRTLSPGICYMRSELRAGDIEDGMSQTYMIGERGMRPEQYDSLNSSQGYYLAADGRDPYSHGRVGPFVDVSWSPDDLINAVNAFPPVPDSEDSWPLQFGSAHPSHWNVAFCDGSVRSLSFEIDLTTHIRLGYRDDGVAVDMSKLE